MPIDKKANLKRILKSVAATHPVHAPVTGKGKQTNKIRPKASNLSISFALFRVRAKSQSKKLAHNLNLRNLLETGSRNNSSGATGTILPKTAKKKVLVTLWCITKIPKGIAPLNSEIGNEEIKNITTPSGMPLINNDS
jgi:hypothetical protein